MSYGSFQKKILTFLLSSSLVLALPATAAPLQTPAASSEKAAVNTATKKAVEALFESIDYANTYQQTLSRLIEVQIQQQPRLAPYRQIMTDFLNKYISWDAIKDEVIALYSDTFTTAEIKALTAFYSTPLGKKSLKAMPELTAQGAALGQRRVIAHEQELLALIREAEKEISKEE
jgi:hypothetical protein